MAKRTEQGGAEKISAGGWARILALIGAFPALYMVLSMVRRILGIDAGVLAVVTVLIAFGMGVVTLILGFLAWAFPPDAPPPPSPSGKRRKKRRAT